jgi:formylglycine-generating enzyme required for sulfatase activity
MKKLSLIFSLSLIVLQLAAQQDKVLKEHKQKGKLPPGTVWLRDSLCIDQTEIRNLDYMEFVKWTEKHDPQNVKTVLPDTMVWYEDGSARFGIERYYFQSPTYREYPVVGVSYEQAVAFCKWRTDRVKEFITLSKQSIQERMGVRDFYYRLPTKQEWEYAATAEFGQIIINKNNLPNVYVAETKTLYEKNMAFPEAVPVKYQFPNRFNLYNTIGNVAEMVQEKGIAKGGSAHHSLEQCSIIGSLTYTKPTEWLGFRCVCVLVK